MHWVLTRDGVGRGRAAGPGDLMKNVSAWNERKGRLFTEVHIGRAADRLRTQHWVAEPLG